MCVITICALTRFKVCYFAPKMDKVKNKMEIETCRFLLPYHVH